MSDTCSESGVLTVLFPLPVLPTMATRSPDSIFREIFFKMSCPLVAYRTVAFRNSIEPVLGQLVGTSSPPLVTQSSSGASSVYSRTRWNCTQISINHGLNKRLGLLETYRLHVKAQTVETKDERQDLVAELGRLQQAEARKAGGQLASLRQSKRRCQDVDCRS